VDNVMLDPDGLITQVSVTLGDFGIRATFVSLAVAKIACGIRQTVIER
jgi:hypothetical protein